jgi:hypothetical protein
MEGKIMSDDKMVSDGTNELEDQITHHLRYLYNTKAEDMQSLAHIRERLLKNSKESLPAIDPLKNTPELPYEGQMPPVRLCPARPAWKKRTVWSQRLLQLVAVLLVAAITGAFAILLTVSHTSSGGNIALRPGWQQVAVYSGKGNSTITGLKQSLPQIWASSLTCRGDGAVNIAMSGMGVLESQDGTDSCQFPQLTLSQPISFSYNESSTVVIQTIKVTANANTSWQFHLLQATKQPTFHLGSEWKVNGGEGSDNGITFTKNAPDDQWHRQSMLKGATMQISVGDTGTSMRTWAILTICFGSGKSHIQLSPNVGNIPMPACDGQPELTVLRFPTATTVDTMTVFAEGDIVWNASMASCTDEARCQQVPALHVTPEA